MITKSQSTQALIIPIVTFLLVSAGLVAIWRQVDRTESRLLNLRTQTTAEQVSLRLESFIAARLHVIRQLSYLWQRDQSNTQERFTQAAEAIQAEFSSVQAINWIDRDGVIRWVVPQSGNLAAKDREVRAHRGMSEILATAARTKTARASFPLDLFQGGRGFTTYFPLVRDGRLQGYVNGVFRMDPVAMDCLDSEVRGHFYVQVMDHGQMLITHGPAEAFGQADSCFSYPVQVLDRQWTVSLSPTPHLIGEYRSRADDVLLVVGIVLAAGLAAALRAHMLRQAERLKTERALKLTQFAMDHAAVATFWIRENATFSYVNLAACEWLGYTREELLSMAVPDIDPSFTGERWQRQWDTVNQLGRPYTFETRQRRRDGTSFPVEITASAVDYKGAYYHFAVAKDITERKRAEEDRLHMERALLEAQRLESLGLLAGGVAHDFNNLLTAMMGSVTLVRKAVEPGSPLTEHLEHIEAAAQQAADLARQLLAYSGKGKFLVATLDLRSLIDQTGHLLRVSIPKRVRLGYELPESPVYVQADAAQARQILMNLVINAAEAIGDADGEIVVRAASVEVNQETLAEAYSDGDLPVGRYAMLEVSDSGRGITARDKIRIFEPFFSTKGTGRGLGLAAVLGIVRGHRGAIKVESQPNRGTTFRVLLPEAAASQETDDEGPAPLSTPPPLDGATVLVIDDEEPVRTVAKIILEDNGFTVLTAEDGQQGVDLLSQHAASVQAVLLDMTMPRMDGHEALTRMRQIRPDLRVLLSSGYDESAAACDESDGRITDFIQKPYRADQLLNKLQELIAR